MDQTKKVFPLLEYYTNQIEENKYDKEKKEKASSDYKLYIKDRILEAMRIGYTMLIDDVANILDLEEAYIRRTLLDKLEYIILPLGAADVFNVKEMPQFNFMELRIRRWKKIYIRESSFAKFMETYIFIQAPYQKIHYDETRNTYVATKNEKGKESIYYKEYPYYNRYNYHFIRKSNYIEIIAKKKTEEFYRKTKGDIIASYTNEEIDSTRLNHEMELLSAAERNQTFRINAYLNEVEKYAEEQGLIKLKLKLDLESTLSEKKNDVIFYNYPETKK